MQGSANAICGASGRQKAYTVSPPPRAVPSFPIQPGVQPDPERDTCDHWHRQHEDDAEVRNLVAIGERTVQHNGRHDREDQGADGHHQKIARRNGHRLALGLSRRGAGSGDFVVLGGHDGSRDDRKSSVSGDGERTPLKTLDGHHTRARAFRAFQAAPTTRPGATIAGRSAAIAPNR